MLGFLYAYAHRLSGLRAVVAHCARALGTSNFSSLSSALARPSSLGFVRGLVEHLERGHRPGSGDLVAIDAMALTVSSRQRHRAKLCNRQTAGGAVVWAYWLGARRGQCPVKVLKVIEGAWCDSRAMLGVELVRKGPVYLMDRGYYAFALFEKWLGSGVRFIVRARENCLVYTVLRTLSTPRMIGNNQLLQDALVRLGAKSAKRHPQVRLIVARLASGKSLTLVSDRLEWSAEDILSAYRQRWEIERFHRFLKETMGLAHLYSFHGSGMAFLLYTSLLLALVLLLASGSARPKRQTILMLHDLLREARARAGIGTAWKRNASTRKGRKQRRTRGKNP